jgi:glycerophosphoryl diester phosphodiesterase
MLIMANAASRACGPPNATGAQSSWASTLWVWTVDDEEQVAKFMRDPRVAVLITNRPDVAMRFR